MLREPAGEGNVVEGLSLGKLTEPDSAANNDDRS